MKRISVKAMKYFSVLIFLAAITSAKAQTITGPFAVGVNQGYTYYYDDGTTISNPSWTTTGGIINRQWSSGTTYYVSVTWTTVGSKVLSFTVKTKTITVNSCTTISLPTASSASRCGPGSVTLTASDPGTGYGIRWYSGSYSPILGTGLTFAAPNLSATTNYSAAKYSTSTGCESGWVTVTATINPIPTATAPNSTICSGSGAAITITNNVPGTTNTWTAGSTGVSGASGGSGVSSSTSPYTYLLNQTLAATSTSNGTVTYNITPSANGCTGTSINATATVKPTPALSATGNNQSICSGQSCSISLGNPNGLSGISYSYSVSQANASGAAGATNTTSSSISQQLNTTSASPGSVVYTITAAASNGCVSLPQNVTVNVKPNPTVSAGNQDICSGSATSIVLTNNIASTTNNWTVASSGVSGASAGSGVSAATAPFTYTIAQTLTAPLGSVGTTTYTVTPSVNGCTGSPANIMVHVDNPSTPNSPASAFQYCEWESMPLTTSSTPSYPFYKWYDGSTNQLLYTGLVYTPANLNSGTYSYKVTNLSYYNCESATSATVNLQVGYAACETYLNWNESLSYNYNSPTDPTIVLVGDAKEYYDGFGNTFQSQVKSISNNQVLANDKIYDSYVNQSLSTMAAPINSSTFGYRHRFTVNSNGQKYSASDFDASGNGPGSVDQPNAIGSNGQGSLGWYYSSSNTTEPNTPTTSYPFSRSYTPQGPNPLSTRATGPGDVYKMGGGHEVKTDKSFFNASELSHYYSLRTFFSQFNYSTVSTPLSIGNPLTNLSLFPAVQSAVVSSTAPYLTISSAASGNPGVYPVNNSSFPVSPGTVCNFTITGYKTGSTGTANLRIADQNGNTLAWGATIPNDYPATVNVSYTVPASGVSAINLGIQWSTPASGEVVFVANANLQIQVPSSTPVGNAGYKILSTDPDGKMTASYMDAEGNTLASVFVNSVSGTVPYQTFSVDNNTWSYNFYNAIGQLVASVAPNGIAVGGTLVGTSVAPNFVTTYKYDQLGRLIETTSPDEGTSQFVYSTDGKIRFSQNQEQRNAAPKRFSYTNYDYLGRLVESGEYSCSGTNYFNFDATDVATPSSNSVLSITDNNIPRGYDVETITAGSTDASYFNGPSVTLDNARCTDYTLIKYDLPQSDLPGGDANHAVQNNLMGQVAKTKNANATTWYSYDEFGLVEWTKQYISTSSPVTANQQPVTWTNLVNVTQTGTTLTKTGGVNATWDAGAFSVQYIPADTDGYIEFTSSQTTTGKVIGLSSTDANVNYTSINFAISLTTGGTITIFENGTGKGGFGAYAVTDVFRVERQGSTIYYKKNGTVIYTSTIASRTALYGDCSFNSSGGTLKNYTLAVTNGLGAMGYQVQPPVQWATLTNVTQNGTSLTKTGGTTGTWDAGAFSSQKIPASTDGYLEFKAGETGANKSIGLSASDANVNYNTINYSFNLSAAGSLIVYENGVSKGTYGTFTTSDVLRIERKGSVIYYKRNGATVYTSATASTSDLYIDCSFNAANASLTGILLEQPFGTKTVDYVYDFLGNVKQVAYQKGQNDAFYYHYTYDQDGRLITAATSFDGTNTTPQAKYYYYLHGPLKRVELANNLQGIDYVYTINGALKSINDADASKDPGADGSNGFSSDVFGETLSYFSTDYAGANHSAGVFNASGLNDYFGGPIKSAAWFTPVDNSTATKRFYGYSYDNLNRFTNAQWGTVSGSGNYTASLSPTNYNESVGAYDNNGNIKALNRNDKNGNALGNYTYNYTANTNRLASISGSTTVNYTYNNIGQMTQQAEGTNTMKVAYNAYGLTKEVRDGNNTLTEQYFYDDRGDLVKKVYYNPNSLVPFKVAYYVRDASGNVLATYEQTNGGLLALVELPIYGSGRLGMVKMKGGQPKYFYEMNDHLGNVRTVIGTPYTDNFVATMEPANSARETKQFVDITQTAVPYASANHTPDFVVPPNTAVTSSYVSRLNAQQNGSIAPHIIGPGIILPVAPGDVISASVYGYYEGSTGNGTGSLSATTIAAALVSALSGVTPGDPNVLQNSMNSAYNATGPFAGELNNTNDAVPHAYLNMIQFDGNLNFNAALPAQAVTFSSPTPGTKMPVSFSNVTITQPGYVYIWVNVTGNSSNYVYFDDLSVSQLHSPFVAGGDFYPFGLTMDDRQIKSERYRYGYQGKYSEYDSLTKTNQFKLRLYDSRFGRWLTFDPKGQHNSPYIGMGNDPVSRTDPDGGFDWFLNNVTGEVKYVEGVTALEGWTSIAKDGATNAEVRAGLVKTVGFYNTVFDQGREFLDLKALDNYKMWKQWSANIGASSGYYNTFGSGNVASKASKIRNLNTSARALEDGTKNFANETKILGKEANNIAKKGARVFTETGRDGDLILYSTKVGDEVIEFGGNFSRIDETLIIKNFDIDGALTNKLGIRGVKDLINDFGKNQGVKEIIVEGAKRTTGALPGKIPARLIFRIHY